jgi:hypothetical protein
MKEFTLPAFFWDAGKFATRYGIKMNDDFYVAGGKLVVVPPIADDPPIFEAPDPANIVARPGAVALVDTVASGPCSMRGVLLVAIDELNLHALKINSILDAVDASTSLADLKTRIAAIADYPQRTAAQAKNAVKAKINSGDAD